MTCRDRNGFIVRIRSSAGSSVGIGFVVGERQVVTCAHVVNSALGRDQHAGETPRPDDRLEIDFPLLGDAEGSPTRNCRVSKWIPPPSKGVSGGDVAGLVLVGEGLPRDAGPAELIEADRIPGVEVSVFGYGDDSRDRQGAWSALRVRGVVGGGNIQLDTETESVFQPRPGYSGSPVVARLDDGDVVAGMLAVSRDWTDDLRDAYAMPVSRIAAAWPEVLGTLLAGPPAPGGATAAGVAGQPLAPPASVMEPGSSTAAMPSPGAQPITQQPTTPQPGLPQPALAEVIAGNWMIDVQSPQGGLLQMMLALTMPRSGQPQFQGTFLGTPMPMEVSGYWWVMGNQVRLNGVQTVAGAMPTQYPYDVIVTFASWSYTQLIGVSSNGERVVWQRRN
jgi:Trypsin-like peptidase domain